MSETGLEDPVCKPTSQFSLNIFMSAAWKHLRYLLNLSSVNKGEASPECLQKTGAYRDREGELSSTHCAAGSICGPAAPEVAI